MSDFQTFVKQRLAAITAQLNAITTNGKKIDEVEPQTILNPNSRIHVSIDGVSQRIDVSQIIQAATNSNYNQILSIGEITVVGGEIKVPAGATWVINNINYTTSSITSLPIALADTGLNRIDILVANNSGQIVLINGIETSSIAIRPNVPVNTVLVTQVNVSDSTIGTPDDPFVGVQFQTKIEKSEAEITDSGVLSEMNVGFENSSFRFTGSVTEIQSFSFEPEFILYPCKEVIFKNFQSIPFTIPHLSVSGTGSHKYFNPTETDLIVNPGEIVKYSISQVSNRLELMSHNKITDLSDYYTKSEVDSLVVGLWDDRGSFDASVNAYPSSGGSGTSGAILKGDIWVISTAGTLPTGQVVEAGDTVRALIDSPGNTQANWAIQQNNIGYVPENTTNKTSSVSGNEASTSLFSNLFGITNWIKSYMLSWIGSHANPVVGTDTILIGKSGVSGTRTFDQFKISIKQNDFSILVHHTQMQPNRIVEVAGINLLTVGTADDSGTGPNYGGNSFARWVRRRYVSASTSGSTVSHTTSSYRIIDNTTSGEFFVSMHVGNEDASAVLTGRDFFGCYNATAFPNINPSAATDLFCLGNDSTDSNMQIMHNDNSGTATKIDLGSNFPANTVSVDHYLFQYWKISGSTTIYYRVKNLHNNIEITGSVTSDLPASNYYPVLMSRNNGSTASAVRLSVSHLIVSENR